MRWQQFFDGVKAGDVGGVYVFQGPEEHVKRSAVEALRARILPPGLEALNEAALDGADAARIIESAETLPMMCERRLLIVYDWAPLTGSKAKDEAEQAARIEAWLARAPESCTVVFYMHGEMDKRKKASKAMEKRARIVDFMFLADQELSKWLAARLKPAGKRLTQDAFETLVFMAGRSLTRLSGEIDKLAASAGAQITADNVRELVAPSVESNVFLMIDSLLSRDAPKAYGILEAMLDAGENCVGLLAMVTRQLRQMAHVKLMTDDKRAPSDIERDLGIQRFACVRLVQKTAGIPSGRLIAGYRESVACDFAVKSGKMRDRAALDKMMLLLQSMA